MAELDLREELKRGVKVHPRVARRTCSRNLAALEKIASALPVFIPFKGKSYKSAMWVLDWDHRIPSRDYILRLYAYYTSQGKAIGELSYADRSEQIARKISPEFDVSDFAGLAADKSTRPRGRWAGI